MDEKATIRLGWTLNYQCYQENTEDLTVCAENHRITQWLAGTPQPHPCHGLGAPQLRLPRAHPQPGAPPAMGHPQLWAALPAPHRPGSGQVEEKGTSWCYREMRLCSISCYLCWQEEAAGAGFVPSVARKGSAADGCMQLLPWVHPQSASPALM